MTAHGRPFRRDGLLKGATKNSLTSSKPTARREALNLFRLIAELDWDFRSAVELSHATEMAILETLAKADDVLGHILATLD